MNRLAFLILLLASLAPIAAAQVSTEPTCVTQSDVDRMIAQIKNGKQLLDKKLRDQIFELKKDTISRFQDKVQLRERESTLTRGVFGIEGRITTLEKAIEKKRDKSEEQLCGILATRGWPTASLISDKGASALFYVLKNFITLETQVTLVPVISEAVAQNEVPFNEDYASFLDRLWLRLGLKQLFGTQASERNGMLVLSPLLSPEKVDSWRERYKMPPLSSYLKFLERSYLMPSVRGLYTDPPTLRSRPKIADDANRLTANSVGGDDTIRVESNIVDLTVRVLSKDFRTNVGGLEQNDFKVYENDAEQEIVAFKRSAQAFDIVLLLDLSGSTALKQNLIRKSAKRFVEAARPGDRVGVVTFTHRIKVISELSADREEITRRIDKVGDEGRTLAWDAIVFTIRKMFGELPPDRRRTVVIMTDGVDNALNYVTRYTAGSRISFAEAVETVRNSDVSVVPIYIDTEIKDPCGVNSPFNCSTYKRSYEQARLTLNFLAEESGGQLYYAAKFEDLDGVYVKVLDDLSTGYGIVYQPIDSNRDGTWRSIRIELPNRPDVIARTKRGYYAR